MITVLLAVYNGEKYLREQLDSIINQSVSDIRIVIRDDGSSDASNAIISEYAEKYPERITVLSGAPSGGAAAAGLEQGDIILKVNGTEVGTMNKLNQELVKFSIGDSVTLTVMRDKTEQEFEVELGGVAIFEETEKN